MSERKPTHPEKSIIKKPDMNRLAEIFNGDLELATFYNEWLNNGKNATRAYLTTHPTALQNSARTLGWRLLKKVDVAVIMREFGLTENLYLQQLYDGVNATKWNDFTGEREADHKVRLPYHDKMGKMLGFEQEGQAPSVAVQINNVVSEQKQKYDL